MTFRRPGRRLPEAPRERCATGRLQVYRNWGSHAGSVRARPQKSRYFRAFQRSRWRATPAGLYAWVMQITHNNACDRLESRQSRSRTLAVRFRATPTPGGSPDVGFEAKGTMRGRVTLVLASVWMASVGYRAPFAAPQGAAQAPGTTAAPARAASAPQSPAVSGSSQQGAVLKQYLSHLSQRPPEDRRSQPRISGPHQPFGPCGNVGEGGTPAAHRVDAARRRAAARPGGI